MPQGGHQSDDLILLAERLAAATRPADRRAAFQEFSDLWNPATVRRLYEEVVRLIHFDISKAERLARSAHWLGKRIEDPASVAASLRALGHVMDRRRKHALALRFYESAAAGYERLADSAEVARTLTSTLQSLIYLGRYEEAMEAAARARGTFEASGDQLRLARLDSNLGNLLHRQDRFVEALDLYQRAYNVLSEIGEPRDIAIVLQNMATCQIGMSEFRGALESYQLARDHCSRHEMPLVVAVADYNIAYLYYLRGEYTRAIELYRAAREHCHESGDRYREALCDLDQSELFLELNLSEEGACLAQRALAAFQRLGVPYESGKALVNLAISLTHRGDGTGALGLFAQAKELFQKEGNQAWISTVELYQALVFHRQGQFARAREMCASALSFFSGSRFSGRAALGQILMARIHLDDGRAAEARAVCLEALHGLERAESPALAYQAYFVMGQAEEVLGRPGAALGAYRRSHQNLENLRSHLQADEMKVAFLKDKLEVYEALVRISLERDDEGARRDAFSYIEQAKSRSLADLIAFRAQTLPAPGAGPQAAVERARTLREELNWLTRAVQIEEAKQAGGRDGLLALLRTSARECERKLVEALGGLQARHQEFASLQTAAAVDLDAIRSSLPKDSLLVEYYRVGDTFYVCVLGKERLKIVPLESVTALRRSLQLLRFQLSKFRLGPEYLNTFRKQLLEATSAHLRAFYRALLAPIERDLDAGHLILAPHDFLHYLPFQALLDGDEPLNARFSISFTPSGSVYHLCSTKPAPTARGSLVLGVPDERAPQILNEVHAVSSALGDARVFTGPEATHDVLRRFGAESRFIHIATHGSFRQDNPMFSSIRLGDCQLSLFDLYQLQLPAELITLSGCGTGLNVVVGGDELMGLKRGLLYAGARCVLLTLWDVNDQSTAEFMQLFYNGLRGGANKAEALRAATEEVRKEWVHPFYWAPFILVGQHL
jgi:CHAT domain-containing protein/tetratricopeptide (TPR) repeat protein